jgi:uncharacterized protein YajQ (UPF0234 family)
MPSFDIVSELNMQEIDNAVNQTAKEIAQRFDFRGTNSEVTLDKTQKIVKILSVGEEKVDNIVGVLQSKAIKRGLDIALLDVGKKEPASGRLVRCEVKLKEGIDKDPAKKIVAFIKELATKVQAAIHDNKIRVTGKKRDDLQEVIQAVKGKNFELPLQFDNFRDS